MNPESHLNRTLLGNNVEPPDEEPFVGIDIGPQSIAENTFKILKKTTCISTEGGLLSFVLVVDCKTYCFHFQQTKSNHSIAP